MNNQQTEWLDRHYDMMSREYTRTQMWEHAIACEELLTKDCKDTWYAYFLERIGYSK